MIQFLKMKLFFDARYITPRQHDGISRYSTELAHSVYKLNNNVVFIIYDDFQLEKLPKQSEHIKIHKPTSWKEPFTAFILNKYSPEVVFSPMQTIGSFGKKYKLVLTVHDLIYFRHNTPPKQFSTLIRFLWWIYHLTFIPERFLLSKCDMVVTVSNTTKKDLLKHQVTKKPIVVVQNAPIAFSSNTKKLDDKPKNLIYMGSFIKYKNVETLVKAMRFLPGYKLHLLSKITQDKKEELLALTNFKSQIVFYNGVTDSEYLDILLNNSILVTASLDEGYGLPVAEALINKVPTVVSNIPIFHEVAGPGALYFKPNNSKDFAEKVKLLQEKNMYQKIAEAGYEHIKKFNWDKSAKLLLEEINFNLLK